MRKVVTIFSILIITLFISASLGFTSRKNTSENFISDDLGEFYAHSENTTYINRYVENLFLVLSDSTDSDSVVIYDSTQVLLTPDSVKLDTMYLDSLGRVDSMALDSTARIKHFNYTQPDYYATSPTSRYKSSFFVYPSLSYTKKEVKLDSTGQVVFITESVAGNKSKLLLKMPLDDYIKRMIDEVNKKELNTLSHKYDLLSQKDDLGNILSNITNIEIPLPSVSFLSIFGPPKINLRINGSVDIHGAWRNETTDELTASALGNTRNEPDFSQQVQISVNGTIGDKLTIGADWNTERTFEYENQLKLQYKGYEDEIIQSIEAGNVSLQTSSLVGGSEALFGIKAKFQFGPFSLTAIASQKKGEVKEVAVSGGSKKQEFSFDAYNYSENNYFVDTIYASEKENIFNNYYGKITPQTDNRFYIKELEVWKSTTKDYNDATQKTANLDIKLPPIKPDEKYNSSFRAKTGPRPGAIEPIPGETVIQQRFEKLEEGTDYIFHRETGFITFKTQVQREDILGVAYRTQGQPGTPSSEDNVYGEFYTSIDPTDTVIVLKLIKPKNLLPSHTMAWKLQLRNIYPLGGREINEEGFKLDMFYTTEGKEPQNNYNGKNLLREFGLDILNKGKEATPDGEFDFRPGITILPETGEIIFPVLEPFGRDLPSNLSKDIAYTSIYEKSKTFAKDDVGKNKFKIKGEYSASISSTFQIGFNVVENSVRVTLDGKKLKAGSDYAVDYNIGQITIRNAAALVPGANLKITFEQNDLFQLASKTLLGIRGLYEFSKNTKLGFSFLNLNQKTLSDKVRIGEEPLNNSIYGIDFKTKHDLPFVTTALDKVFSTSAKSSFNLSGEFAYMDPDPNTKKSKIPTDGGKSIAYIDDFEGSKRTIPIGISYTIWKDLSVPDSLPYIYTKPKLEQMRYKGKSFWYNVLPSQTYSPDIWPEKKVATKDKAVTVLDFVYRPHQKGMYNNDPNLENNSDKAWGGMMKSLSSSATNLVDEKIEALEFWINIKNAPQDAVLNIDLGQISEDIIPNLVFNNEDQLPRNDVIDLDKGEDTGIDGLTNANEPNYDPVTNKDPNGDDFRIVQGGLEPDDFVNINGTEGNAELASIGRFPDSEDLNGSKNIDVINSYYRYTVPLDTTRANNPFIAGGGSIKKNRNRSTWYLIKIPLKDWKTKIGSPTFSLVEFIRLWVGGVDEEIHFQLAEFNLVGNQWQKIVDGITVTKKDSALTVSNISIEENPEYYLPNGIDRERDRTNPDQNVLKNEQSLNLIFNNLEDGESRTVVKYLVKGLDVFNYSAMKLFVHGDLDDREGSISFYEDENNFGSELYFRFGADSTNYYEYIRPTKAGWEEISINFEELTAIKEMRPIDSLDVPYRVPVPGKPGHYYGIKGAPSLTKIMFLALGVKNPIDKGLHLEPVSGNLWVNELRVVGANDKAGWAMTSSASLKLADIMSVSASYKQTDPYFHRLSERFGKRLDSRNWNVQGNLNIIKLLPFKMPGSKLAVNVSHSEAISTPLYKPRTDIAVASAAQSSSNPDSLKRETETVSVRNTLSISNIQLKIPSKAWYIRETINGLSFSYSFNNSESRSPATKLASSWGWNSSGKYQAKFSRDNYFQPANIPIIGEIFKIFKDYRNVKVYFTPQNFNAGFSTKRSYKYTKVRTVGVAANVSRNFIASRNANFAWKITEGGFFNISTNYKVSASSSLLYLLLDQEGKKRSESDIWSEIFNGSLFGRDNSYSQIIGLNLKPKMPSLLSLDKYFTLSSSYSVTYNWKNNYSQPKLGRNAGWVNRLSASLQVKLKSITKPVFAFLKPGTSVKSTSSNSSKGRSRGRSRSKYSKRGGRGKDAKLEEPKESKEVVATDTLTSADKGPSVLTKALGYLLGTIQYTMFDYDNITLSFSQNNSQGNNGLLGEGTGFWNFWGTQYENINGPSRLYQIGLTRDPGPRVSGGTLGDKFSQKNKISIKTKRSLWKNANIDLNWDLGWGVNKSTTLHVDSLTGEKIITNTTASGNIDRSFLTFPIAGASVEAINNLYDPTADNTNESLSNAFVEGLESIPLLSTLPLFKDVGKFIPRPNWRLSWSGLEKLPLVGKLFKRASLTHAYTSKYIEGWKLNADGIEETQTKKISYGFTPLVGLNLTFAELWGGNITGNIKYSTKKDYSLAFAQKTTTESFSTDINVSLSFSKSGFNLPLFGLALKNDIEVSFAYTQGQNSVLIYYLGDKFKKGGTPQDGTQRVTIEPRIKYVMSSRVTLSLFYKRTSIEPEGASRIPATTTNETGLDVHISIQ